MYKDIIQHVRILSLRIHTVQPGMNRNETSSYCEFNPLRQPNQFTTSYSLSILKRSMATSQSMLPIVVNLFNQFTHCQVSQSPCRISVIPSFVWQHLLAINRKLLHSQLPVHCCHCNELQKKPFNIFQMIFTKEETSLQTPQKLV